MKRCCRCCFRLKILYKMKLKAQKKKCVRKGNGEHLAYALTWSCSLWTFPCRLGKGTPGSCWCRPSPRPSAHGSATRGSRWHRTYWHSNPGGMNAEQVSPVKKSSLLARHMSREKAIKHVSEAQRFLLPVNDTSGKQKKKLRCLSAALLFH